MTDLDLDREIRHHLARVVDAAPLPPPIDRISARGPVSPAHRIAVDPGAPPGDRERAPRRRPTRRLSVVAMALALVVVATMVVLAGGWTGHPHNGPDRIAAGPDPGATGRSAPRGSGSPGTGAGATLPAGYGPPAELAPLPEVAREPVLITTTGRHLVVGSTYGPSDGGPGFAFGDGQRVLLSTFAWAEPHGDTWLYGTQGLPQDATLRALASSDTGVVAAAVTRSTAPGDLDSPLVLLSSDQGRTWSQHKLPTPRSPGSRQVAAAAVGPDRLIVAGPEGIWTADLDHPDQWRYIEIPCRALLAATWDGSQFILAGLVNDPAANVALFRSPDGITWSTPQPAAGVAENPETSSDGVAQLISAGDGRTLLLTTSKLGLWGLGDTVGGSTTATILTDGVPAGTTTVTGWQFRAAVATAGGFVTAASDLSHGYEPRLLASADGLSWRDLGRAPAGMASGAAWQGGIVINGWSDGVSPRRTWFLPAADDPPHQGPVAAVTVPASVPASRAGSASSGPDRTPG